MTALIPELYVADLDASLAFYAALGFAVVYRREEERFARIARGGAEIMLEEPRGRTWLLAPLAHPRGVGVNLQITVADADALFAARPDGAAVVLPPEVKRYARRNDVLTVRQFVVADPDGYLIRFSEVTATDVSPHNREQLPADRPSR